MTRPRTPCDELGELLLELVYEELPADEAARLRAHAATCAACAAAIAELEGTRRLVRSALPEVSPPPAVDALILDTARTEAERLATLAVRPATVRARPAAERRAAFSWLLHPGLAAAATVALVAGVSFFVYRTGRPPADGQRGEPLADVARALEETEPPPRPAATTAFAAPEPAEAEAKSEAAHAPAAMPAKKAEAQAPLAAGGKGRAGAGEAALDDLLGGGDPRPGDSGGGGLANGYATRAPARDQGFAEPAPAAEEQRDRALAKSASAPAPAAGAAAPAAAPRAEDSGIRSRADEEGLAVPPTSPPPLDTDRELGLRLAKRGRCAEAVVHLAAYRGRAAAGDPGYPEALWELGRCQRRLGRLADARASFVELGRYPAWRARADAALDEIDAAP